MPADADTMLLVVCESDTVARPALFTGRFSVICPLSVAERERYGAFTGTPGPDILALNLGGLVYVFHAGKMSFFHAAAARRSPLNQAAKLVAALLRVARVTAGLAESNSSPPPGL